MEAKLAGDFVNLSKRRKEAANKMQHIRAACGDNIRYVLFLAGSD
ncbi:XamI family restriction endonuclease [uncultured Chloroflexus sp.]